MNENGELFSDSCGFNGMVIGSSLFPHKKIHKATWVSPDHRTENQIDHLCIYVGADHHLVLGRFKLKLKTFKTTAEKTGYRYNT